MYAWIGVAYPPTVRLCLSNWRSPLPRPPPRLDWRSSRTFSSVGLPRLAALPAVRSRKALCLLVRVWRKFCTIYGVDGTWALTHHPRCLGSLRDGYLVPHHLLEPWKLVPLQEHCAWCCVLGSYQWPSQVAPVPCRSLDHDHCLFVTSCQFVSWPIVFCSVSFVIPSNS